MSAGTASGPRRGFTLIELIVVMLIIGIAGFVIVPALLRDAPSDTAAVAQPMATVLRAARRVAIDSGQSARLVLDPSSLRYVVQMSSSARTVAEGTVPLPAGATVAADSARATFQFAPNGTAIGDSIVVSGAAQRVFVAVDRWTGEVILRAN